ncbi:class I SAM-dependent methyltransferase [archaeon]|nr:class I SAM-dependent methyltransferase [archaeon]NDB78566.1 class I SAM-dependent methyltransferase [archaeon]
MKNLEILDTTNLQPEDWDYIYQSNGYEDQGSGPGSTIENTYPLIYWLKTFIANNNIYSILDIGCGDLQWIPTLLKDMPEVSYTGVDCVQNIIQKHQEVFPDYNFICSDIYDRDFEIEGHYDLVLCKDVIHHRINEIDLILENIDRIKSGAYIIICPEYLAIDITKVSTDYRWIHSYTADEPKGISIKINRL